MTSEEKTPVWRSSEQIQKEIALTEKQTEEINKEQAQQPLIGEKQDLSSLQAEYSANPIFSKKLEELTQTHSTRRSIRGDGNCFYRSYMFSICEQKLSGLISEETWKEMKEKIEGSLPLLESVGYPDYILEPFLEEIQAVLQVVDQNTTENMDAEECLGLVLSLFCDEDSQMYLIYMLRYLTSLHLKTNQDNFLPYVLDHGNVELFCKSQVDAVNVEADQVQCIALSTYLNIPVRIYYLDQGNNPLNFHDFPAGSTPVVHILYRPGHFDIIYPDIAEN